MAKRRLNKNLVAFLTAAGVLLAVIVVAIAAINLARKDPEALAQKALGQEEAGDLGRAVSLYRAAYNANREPKYLIEAARCAHEMGELNEMFSLLRFADAQSPRDAQVLGAVVGRYWEIREISLGQWNDVLDYATRLLELEPDNLLALASKSEALERMRAQDTSYEAEGDAALARALEIDPTSPYVALTWASRDRAHAEEKAREAIQNGQEAVAQEFVTRAREERIKLLQPALSANPGDGEIRLALASAILADGQVERCREILEAGLAESPDDPDTHLALASVALAEVQTKEQDGVDDEADVIALLGAGLEHVNRAAEIEPVLYPAYGLRAELRRRRWVSDGRWESEPTACQQEILESFDAALRGTVGLRSIRAALSRGDRLRLIGTAFDTAYRFHNVSEDEVAREQALTYMERFRQEAQTQFPEHALAALMEGQVALAKNDDRLAVKAFSEAEKRGVATRFALVAQEELARLYHRIEELGLSLRYTVTAIESYQQRRRVPPQWLFLNQAEVLLALDRDQEALDLVESIAPLFPEKQVLDGIRARVLAKLGRGTEAMQLLQESTSDGVGTLVSQARVAAFDQDYDTAVGLLREALEQTPDHLPTIRLFVQASLAADRREEAVQFVAERAEAVTDERAQRILRSYGVMLTTDDGEQRNQQLLELIAETPEGFERAREYFSFWVSQDDYERAGTYLDEMERLAGDDAGTLREVQRMQFNLALRMQNCDKVGRYAVALAQANADQVGGAIFRGRYELACGDPTKALSEFRAAEREFPTDSEVKLHIARALLSLEHPSYEEAIQTLERVIEFDPRSFLACKLLFACYDQTGRYREGIAYLEMAAKLNPDDPYVKKRSQLLEEERDPRQGIARREPLREQDPEDIANLLRLVELYGRVGDDALAEERLREAIRIAPGKIEVARIGATFFARRKNREAGEQLLAQHLAAQEGQGIVVAHLLLGRFYERLGDREAALRSYQQAQQDVGEALSGDTDEDRRRMAVFSASELAEFYRRGRNYAEAIDAYRLVLASIGSDQIVSIQNARRVIIRGLLSLDRHGEAEAEIVAYRRDFPDDPRGLMAHAELLMARNELNEARDLLTRGLETDPDHAWSLYMRGLINVEQHRLTDARGDLLRAKAISPESFNLQHRLSLARLYELMEKPGLAEAELRELLSLDRGGSRQVELRLISLLNNTNQFQKAHEFVSELMVRDPEQAFWPLALGKSLAARGQHGAAVSPLQRAVELSGGQSTEIVARWLLALIRAGRTAEATQAFEGLDPGVTAPLVQAHAAEAYSAENQPEVAVALLEQAIDGAGRRGVQQARFVVGRAMAVLGRDEGLTVLRRIREHVADTDVELVMSTVLAAELAADGDPARRAEGLEISKAVIAAAPKGGAVYLEALQVQLQTLGAEGRYDEVVKFYEELLTLAPNNLQALNNLAYMLADKLGRPAEALQYAERLRDLDVDDEAKPSILDTVGWVYFKNDRAEQAEGAFLEALRLEPDSLIVRYHLGQVYAENGQNTVAERAFRRVLELAREQQDEEFEKKAEEALEKLR